MDTFYMLYGYSVSFGQLVVLSSKHGNYPTRYMLCLFNNICFSILTATAYPVNWTFVCQITFTKYFETKVKTNKN